jgi:hypothetical protein
MALEQNGPAAYTLRRTEAAKTLDPSEKGAVNYFLGLTIGKLFADRVLNVPWMMHLDVFRPMLNPLLKGRSRPDLVGQGSSGQWVAFECKGRATEPNATAKDKAKEQAERLVRINGAAPALNAACFTYYRNDVVEFFWRDPPPEREPKKPPIEVRVEPDDWRYYYLPVLDILRSQSDAFHPGSERGSVRIPALDLEVAVEPRVLVSIGEERWDDARRLSESVGDDFHRDGIKVSAGPSWLRPFAE